MSVPMPTSALNSHQVPTRGCLDAMARALSRGGTLSWAPRAAARRRASASNLWSAGTESSFGSSSLPSVLIWREPTAGDPAEVCVLAGAEPSSTLPALENRADLLRCLGENVQDLLTGGVVRDAAHRIAHLETKRVDGGLDVAGRGGSDRAAGVPRTARPGPVVRRARRRRTRTCLLGRLLQLGT